MLGVRAPLLYEPGRERERDCLLRRAASGEQASSCECAAEIAVWGSVRRDPDVDKPLPPRAGVAAVPSVPQAASSVWSRADGSADAKAEDAGDFDGVVEAALA
mmetsp:Transcript_15587/g.33290  ORF Transcript_15587/g.33290 Transcript_15587/m.33290 type:complete len:103 (-) Transcript_15587:243-551(-)